MHRRRSGASRRAGVSRAVEDRDAAERVMPIGHVDREARLNRLLSAAGRFSSGTGDVSIRHDEIAGEADW